MPTAKPKNIHEAMLKFHSLFHGAQKSGTNLHFRSKYFTLDDLVEAITPSLQECGLYVAHQVKDGCLWTQVFNADGDSLASSIMLPPTTNPQVMGSNMTYFKKYNITGLFNIPEASDLDDDGTLGADAAEIERQKEKTIVPKPKATEAQRQLLADWCDSDKLDQRQIKYITANIDKMTTEDAQNLLDKINTAQETE